MATAIQTYEEQVTVSDKPGYKLHFKVIGTEDTPTAMSAMTGVLTAFYHSLPFQDFQLDHIGGGVWDAVANYYYEPSDSVPQFGFDTTGGTTNIKQAKEEVNVYSLSGSPTYKGAIGVTNNSVDGCDIVIPVYKFTETFVFPNATIDSSFKSTVFFLTGRVNDDSFRGLAAGECLFEGARGAQRGNGKWEITFHFAASPNLTGLSVGDISGIDKDGWHYLWVRYQEVKDSDRMVKQPREAIINRVYDAGDFTLLGIGS